MRNSISLYHVFKIGIVVKLVNVVGKNSVAESKLLLWRQQCTRSTLWQLTKYIKLTTSGTSPALWMRADLMDWKKSTTPSVFSRSNWAWMQMNVPVRPTPSLCKENQDYFISALWPCFAVMVWHRKYPAPPYSNPLLFDVVNELYKECLKPLIFH